MDFLQSEFWWLCWAGGSVSFATYQISRHTASLRRFRLESWTGLLAMGFVLVSFAVTDWKGALATFFGTVVFGVILFLVFMYLVHPSDES